MFENVFNLLKKNFFFCTFLTQGGGAGVHNSLSRIEPRLLSFNIHFGRKKRFSVKTYT